MMVIVLCLSVFLGFSNTKDPVLITFEEITKEILQSEHNSKSEGYMYASYLKGLDGFNDYVLVECDTGGYAIYEKESMEIIQYSDTNNSPFLDVSKENRYYGGPANYYRQKENVLENIYNDSIKMNEKDRLIYSEIIKQHIIENREKRIIELEKKLSVAKNDKTIEENDFELNSPGTTGSGSFNAEKYTVLSRNYIPYYQFFIDYEKHGENINGTCATIAAQILLAYNNWINDGRLIPANPKQGEKFLFDRSESDLNKIYCNNMRGTTSKSDEADGGVSFYDKLLTYIDIEENGASLYEVYYGIYEYLMEYSPIAVNDVYIDRYHESAQNSIATKEKVLSEIDSGRPIIAAINYYETMDEGGSVEPHAVVIYGYQTIKFNNQPIDGVIAHMGWGARDNDWFNIDWLKGYVSFRTTHVHDDSAFNDSLHLVKCGVCTRITALNNHSFNNVTQIKYNENELSVEKVAEMRDRARRFHVAECACGYKEELPHEFEYVSEGSDGHSKKCSKCDYYLTVTSTSNVAMIYDHLYKTSDTCWYCHYTQLPRE